MDEVAPELGEKWWLNDMQNTVSVLVQMVPISHKNHSDHHRPLRDILVHIL
jgi:hypothetical protein